MANKGSKDTGRGKVERVIKKDVFKRGTGDQPGSIKDVHEVVDTHPPPPPKDKDKGDKE